MQNSHLKCQKFWCLWIKILVLRCVYDSFFRYTKSTSIFTRFDNEIFSSFSAWEEMNFFLIQTLWFYFCSHTKFDYPLAMPFAIRGWNMGEDFKGYYRGECKTKMFSRILSLWKLSFFTGKTNCSKFKSLVIPPDHMCLSKNICIHDINSRFLLNSPICTLKPLFGIKISFKFMWKDLKGKIAPTFFYLTLNCENCWKFTR